MPVIKTVIKAGMKRSLSPDRGDHRPAAAAQLDAGGEGADCCGKRGAGRQHLGCRAAVGDQSRSSFGLATARWAGVGESGCGDDASSAVCASYDRGARSGSSSIVTHGRRRRPGRPVGSSSEMGESRLVLTGLVDPALTAAIVGALRVPR